MNKEFLRSKLSVTQFRRLRNLYHDLIASGYGFNLNRLAKIYGTDKVGDHNYTPHYISHFRKFKFKSINLLEIGVGGYNDIHKGANSLRMWKKYFPFGQIFGIDIFDKSPLEEPRIKIFRGSQVDVNFLEDVVMRTGELDIIIDDGSHINEHVIQTFKLLFPKLKDGGIYVIEDTQTSYWEDFGGDSKDLKNSNTTMNFFKHLTDSMNNEEFVIDRYEKTIFDKKIVSMHFYHNLIFIYKGDNNEKSNQVVDNRR